MAEEDDAGEVQAEEPEDAAPATEEPEDAAPATEEPEDAAPADAAEAGAPAPPPPARSSNQTEAVYDIPVKVSTVLGEAAVRVSSLMKLGRGAVIELDRKIGEPIDLFVNDRLVARGNLTVTDGRLGVTMTEIIRSNIKPDAS